MEGEWNKPPLVLVRNYCIKSKLYILEQVANKSYI